MSKTIVTPTTRTTRFLGKCDSCVFPIAVEDADALHDTKQVRCPECDRVVVLERLWGTVTVDNPCDPACTHAIGDECVCACGGANHGIAFVFSLVSHGEATMSSIEKYRATYTKRSVAATKRAADRRAKKAAEKAEADARHAAEAAQFEAEHTQIFTWLRAAAESDTFAGWWCHDFATDVLRYFGNQRYITSGQIGVVNRKIAEAAKRAAEKAEDVANAKPAPLGRQTVTGIVVSVKEQDGYLPGTTELKMLVKVDGYKVWASIPESISYDAYQAAMWAQRDGQDRVNWVGVATWLRGQTITFTATLEPGRDGDPSFVIGKRPAKASVACRKGE